VDKAGTIDVQPWMTAPETRAVMAALIAENEPARFVGGCIRDAILGNPIGDIDIATPAPPETVIARLTAAGIKSVPTGIAHGTVTAVVGASHFEITTLRHDVETFGRHARVAFTDDWAADAQRRDFTMNALFGDADGTIYDPTGGLDDLRAGRVRFVGDAAARIEEDVLRLLRFFRFHAWYGRSPPDESALAACRAMADRLPNLSRERVWSELRRILLAPEPAAAFDLMADNDVLAHVLPEARSRARLASMRRLEDKLALDPDPVRRLIATVEITPDNAPGLAERLRLSNKERARIVANVENAGGVDSGMDQRDAQASLYRLGAALFRDIVLVGWAGDGDAAWSRLWEIGKTWQPPRFMLKGADALALGVAKGPAVGRLLRRVEDWWVGHEFRPDRAACLRRLREEAAKANDA
jgi:poly(A) polymerase